MYSLSFTSQFKKDYKKAEKSNRDLEKLHYAFKTLAISGSLPIENYKTHILRGNYKGYLEAHIEPDWLLIWYKKGEEITLVRTGSHSELF